MWILFKIFEDKRNLIEVMKSQRKLFTISFINENNLNSCSEQTIALAHRRRDLKDQVKSGIAECITLKLSFTISDVVKKVYKDYKTKNFSHS